MRVIITEDYEAMSKKAAAIVRDRLLKKKNLVFGLATGSTPLGLYRELIRMHKEEGLDFSGVVSFNLDEYVGLPSGHEQSYRFFMNENLFNHINIKMENTHVPDGTISPEKAEQYCAQYEEAIKQAGGIDLQVLGIGRDGHIGFNEPGSSLGSFTRLKTLTEETIEDNSRFFKNIDEVPKYAITMGVGSVMNSRQVLLLASGKNKAEVLSKAIEGPITSQVTASVLQMHPKAIIIVDKEAGSLLKRQAYYNFVEKRMEELAGK